MISPKPDVPKRIASKLRSIYRKVFAARDKIAYVEAKSLNILCELEEFENDPYGYAELYYPTIPDPAAYPTVTRTLRLQEWLDDKAHKVPSYHEELLLAEDMMAAIEESVLKELQQLKPNTPGRESWPVKPATLQTLRKQWEIEYSKQRKEGNNYRQLRLENRRQNEEQRKIERQKFLKKIGEEIQKKAAMMPPGRAAAFTSIMEVMQERLFDDQRCLVDLYDIAQGQSSLIKDIISEAESRAIAKLNAITNITHSPSGNDV